MARLECQEWPAGENARPLARACGTARLAAALAFAFPFPATLTADTALCARSEKEHLAADLARADEATGIGLVLWFGFALAMALAWKYHGWLGVSVVMLPIFGWHLWHRIRLGRGGL
jgi:hypothetical protein